MLQVPRPWHRSRVSVSAAFVGTEKDEVAALKYYKIAVKRGFADAYAM